MKKIILFFCLVFSCLLVSPVLAASPLGQDLLNKSVGNVGLQSDLQTSLGNIISTALALLGTMFLVLTIAAGIMWMTAAGNEDKISKAKKILTGAIIGLVIALCAYTITYFVTTRAGGAVTPSADELLNE